jgi:hypothetical protein
MVDNHNFYFLVAIGVFLTVLVAVAGYCYRLRRRSSQVGWEELLARLTWIDREAIAEVASDLAGEAGNEDDGPDHLEPAEHLEPLQLWNLVGGMKGLEVLEANSKILIDLACYLQQRYPEALPIAEQLRLDGRALQWHVGRLKGAAKTGNLEVSFPYYAQRAVATYYLMTRRLLGLYEAVNFSMLPELERTLTPHSTVR